MVLGSKLSFFVLLIVSIGQLSGIKGNSVVVFGAEINTTWANLLPTLPLQESSTIAAGRLSSRFGLVVVVNFLCYLNMSETSAT